MFLGAQALKVSHPKLDALQICIYQKPQLLRLPIRQSSLATVPLQHWKRPGFAGSTTETKRMHPGRLTFWTWDTTPLETENHLPNHHFQVRFVNLRWCRQHRWVPSITKPGDGDGWSHFMPFKDLWCFFLNLRNVSIVSQVSTGHITRKALKKTLFKFLFSDWHDLNQLQKQH